METTKITVKAMLPFHWEQVVGIYSQGLGIATFQNTLPSWEEWNREHVQQCRLVAARGDEITGWAALSAISERCVYAGVAEVSLYVNTPYHGQKIGTTLLRHLIEESEKAGIWTLQAGIFPENKASLKVHENSGFRVVGFREKIGKLNGIWKDTILLERRSQVVGVE